MPNTQNFPKWLNFDDDERLLSPEEMSDALNVRGLSGDSSRSEILKTVKGNVLKEFTLPSGVNKVVGKVEHEENSDLYYFVYNSLNNHSIVKYNSVSNLSTLVLQNDVLSFGSSLIVQGYAVKMENGDVLLGWTDKNVPPRRVNVEKAILHTLGNYSEGYPEILSTGTYGEKELYIDAAKHPPLFKPTFSFSTNNQYSSNRIKGSAFQFTYRYIYEDGEASSYSPISDVAISEYYLSNSVFVGSQEDLNNNVIDIVVSNGGYNVDKIEVAFRKGNNGDWRNIGSFTNKPNQDTQSIYFDNSTTGYLLANPDDVNKNYDSVPILAKSTCFAGNRLAYGNYVEGYDNISNDELSSGLTFKPKYWNRPNIDSPTLFPATSFTQIYTVLSRIDIGSYTPVLGDSIYINVNVSITLTNGSVFGGLAYYYYLVSDPNLSREDIFTSIADNLVGSVFSGVEVAEQSYFNSASNNLFLYFKPAGSRFAAISSATTINSSFHLNSSNVRSSQSFKAGSKSPIGIVYYDRVNRSTSVQRPAENQYVKFFSERISEIEGLGSVEMHNRIGITPPLFATHYKLLYQGSNVSDFIQYTCLKAYRSTGVNGNSLYANNVIYLSMRSLIGRPDSYIPRFNSKISYSYADGDRLRVISYYNTTGAARVYQSGLLDFKVLGMEFFDQSNSPFYDSTNVSTAYSTTGYFLVIENPEVNGWSASDVGAGSSNWYNNSSEEGCFFEIYREKQLTSQSNADNENYPYYECGVENEIIDSGLETRRHKGNVRDQGENISYIVHNVYNQSNGYNYALIKNSIATFNDIKIVVGDRIKLFGQEKSIEVIDVAIDSVNDGTRIYLNEETLVYGTAISLAEDALFAANRITSGDVWFKPRQLRINNDPTTFDTYLDFVEDYYANDFTDSNSWSKGRANAFVENNKQVDRAQSITYSDPFFTNGRYNGLSSFNPAQSPYLDLENNYGSIQLLTNRGDDIIFYQEDKVGRLLVNKNVLYSGDGNSTTITQSTNILSKPEYYLYDGGIGLNPEGFAKNSGVHYFPSIKKGVVCRLSTDGVTPISEYKARTKIYDISKSYLSSINTVKVYGGYDLFNGEYFISYPSTPTGYLSVNGIQFAQKFTGITETSTEIILDVSVISSPSAPKITFGSETRTFSNIIETFSKWGAPFSLLTDISETNTLYVKTSKYSTQVQAEYVDPAATSEVYLKYSDSILLSGTYSISKGKITLLKAQASGAVLSLTTSTDIEYNTLSFNEKENKWVSRWSFEPEMFASVNFRLVSFKNGAMWIHNENPIQGSFYGVETNPSFTIMANIEPTVVKTYRALELQGNAAWECSLLETNLMSTSIQKSLFAQKEGFWYSDVKGASTGSVDGNVVGIGEVISGSASVVVIRGFSRSSVNVTIGDVVYKNGFPIGEITALNNNRINLTSTSGLSIGDFIYVIKNATIDGDLVKGYYAKMKFTQDSTEYSEVFCIRSWITPQALGIQR